MGKCPHHKSCHHKLASLKTVAKNWIGCGDLTHPLGQALWDRAESHRRDSLGEVSSPRLGIDGRPQSTHHISWVLTALKNQKRAIPPSQIIILKISLKESLLGCSENILALSLWKTDFYFAPSEVGREWSIEIRCINYTCPRTCFGMMSLIGGWWKLTWALKDQFCFRISRTLDADRIRRRTAAPTYQIRKIPFISYSQVLGASPLK